MGRKGQSAGGGRGAGRKVGAGGAFNGNDWGKGGWNKLIGELAGERAWPWNAFGEEAVEDTSYFALLFVSPPAGIRLIKQMN
jgi:hypothetical protein